jgi:hypothetical protein
MCHTGAPLRAAAATIAIDSGRLWPGFLLVLHGAPVATATRSAIGELARILVRAASPRQPDVDSVESLSKASGMSRRALQYRCQAAGIAARDCVHFVQCLKSILSADEESWDPAALIPVIYARTLRRILDQAGLAERRRPRLAEFVARQQFCTNQWFKDAVLTELGKDDSS